MRCLRLSISLLALAAVAALAPAAASAQSAQPRIVGGGQVSITDHPYQVRLQIRSGTSVYLCGGVIRDATHVMTAAHCVVMGGAVVSPEDVTVFYGSDDQMAQRPEPVFAVQPAPQYAAGDSSYDAALLTLAAPLLDYGSATVKPITLAPAATLASAVSSGANAFVTGWGVTEQGSTSRYLKGTSIPLRPDSACRTSYGSYYVSARFVCGGGTGTAPQNPDSCSGDSGGPLILPTASGHQLIGLVSFGPQGACGQPGVPAAYTEVSDPAIYSLLTAQTQGPPLIDGGDGASRPRAPAKGDHKPPKAVIKAVTCKRRRCRIRVGATDDGGRVKGVSVKVTRRVSKCSQRGAQRRCVTSLSNRRLATKSSARAFVVTARFKPGAYRISAVATDQAGNHSSAAKRSFHVRR